MISLPEPALILDLWSKNVDPMVDTFPFANNDIWMVAAFLSFTYFLRSFLDQRGQGKKFTSKLRPIIFLYHCFICGLCAGSFLIGLIITDWSHLWYDGACSVNQPFSAAGFGGKIRMYFVYMAILVKVAQLTEFIWMRNSFAFAVSLFETVGALCIMKWDATGRVWLGGAFHMAFIHFGNLFNAIEVSRTEDPVFLYLLRRYWCLFGIGFFTLIGYPHILYTIFNTQCNFPIIYQLGSLVYPIFAYYTYPKIYVDAYSSPAVVSNYEKKGGSLFPQTWESEERTTSKAGACETLFLDVCSMFLSIASFFRG